MERSKGSLKTFITLISEGIPKTALTFALIFSVITTIVGLTIPLLTRELVDGFSLSSISTSLVFVIVAVFIIQAVIDGVSTYLLAYVGQKAVVTLREKLWFKMIRLPVSYFDQQQSGESVSRVVNDTGIVKDLISQHFPQFISGIISIIGAVVILFLMDWKMTLIMLISVPITVLIMVPLGSKMAKISKGLQDETASFSANIQQTFSEIRLMKSSNAEGFEEKKGSKGIYTLLKYGLKEAKVMALVGPFMYTVVMIVIVFIIGYGGIRVAEGTMSTGSLVAFLLYLFQIIYPITSFAMFFTQLQKAKGATERLVAILDMPSEEYDRGQELDLKNKTIRLEEVTFSYEEGEQVVHNISFEAKPGEMIAFAGPSGGGKTTIFSLIERYYEPTKGEILVGEMPVKEISLASWRKQIGYVSQESAMMAGTIRENLCYGLEEEISDDQLWKAAKMAYADEFIQSFKDGLDTVVGERGIKLSGGQKQRIAIARAFLRDPNILLMDEATASLDSQSESAVQEALNRLMEGRTTFVIAHRLSTIVSADKILFVENGKITGSGTHEELILSHPLYRTYAEQQLTDHAG